LKPILKYQTGVVNPKVGILVSFSNFFSEWLAYMLVSSARAAHDILKHVWAKLISLCLLDMSTGVLWWVLGLSSLYALEKLKIHYNMGVQRARGAWYFWIGWSDCLNQGTKRFVSIRAKSIAQITLPNCLLTTTNGQKQSNLMIFELSQPNWRPATFKNSYFGNARC
jgi:hypothetical protein